jgi:class 3 adenylate cyclase
MICASCGAENREEARFCDVCGAALAVAPPREQRKTVTVLFCDVSGSTAFAESRDPEAVRAVMTRYFEVARAAIERHGGTVEKFIGDAVMAVFGVPVVREDDALRAVRAAQELRDGVDIPIRIGVNTGEVVTGSGDSLVTGDAVNVAARLEQAAGTGEVLLGERTYDLVRGAVDAELLPPLEAKGKSDPMTAYRLGAVTGETGVARRIDAPFVGRARERTLLAGAWERCVSERACALFTVLGTAGVGKSRLAAEFLDVVDATVVRDAASPTARGSPTGRSSRSCCSCSATPLHRAPPSRRFSVTGSRRPTTSPLRRESSSNPSQLLVRWSSCWTTCSGVNRRSSI